VKSLGTSDKELRRLNVSYFAASVDSVEANTKFARSLGIGFPILSDPTKEMARAYGVLAPSGYALRWTFYIGADGRILDIDKKVSAATHGPTVVARVAALVNLTS
jgi:thioredoxin-dependent peroxiredoxin